MPAILIYFIKLTLSLSLFYLFYRLVLQRLTFYNWNRWYLVLYSLAAFFIPFLDISSWLESKQWSNEHIVNIIPVIESYAVNEEAIATTSSQFSWWSSFLYLFLAGMLVLLIRLIIQVISFRNMKRSGELITGEGIKIYQVNKDIIPFSFGNSIFINKSLHTEKELKEIILHEFVHVRQKHSIDIMWGEIICIINWYNPFAWMFRKAIRQNLEFIADNQVLESGVDRKEYQYLLLSSLGNDQLSIANQFNFSSLKKRIAMMNKMKTARAHLARFLFVLPVLALLLISFRNNKVNNSITGQQQLPYAAQTIKDTIPPVSLNSKGFYLDIIDVNGHCTVVVKNKESKELERVDLLKWQEKDDYYEEKYGELPNSKPKVTVGRLDNSATEFEVKDNIATLKLRNGKEEKYDLSDKVQKAAFESKFGKVIEVPQMGKMGVTVLQVDADGAVTGVGVGQGSGTAIGNGKAVGQGLSTTAVTGVNGVTVIQGQGLTTAVGSPASVTAIDGEMIQTTTGALTVIDAKGVNLVGTTNQGKTVFDLEDAIVITISKTSSRADLEKHKQDLKAQGIELNFEDVEYNDAGELTSLSGKLKFNDSTGNFVAKDFNKVKIYIVKDQGRIHFKISTQDKVVS